MQPELPPSPITSPKPFPWILLGLILSGFVSTFAAGFFAKDLLSPTPTLPQPTPTPFLQPLETPAVPEPTFEVGAAYLEDTMMAIIPANPPLALVITASRTQKDERFYQSSRMSWFNGQKWERKVHSQWIDSNAIYPDALIRAWNIDYDPSRVLKQSASGSLTFGQERFDFQTGVLENEIGMRSLPTYTKFMSVGKGKVTINSQTYPADFIYTRLYSMNQKELQFYADNLGIRTDWIGFFTEDGQYYHADATAVARPNEIYQSHQIGVYKDTQGGIFKTFQLDFNLSPELPPEKYQVFFDAPISATLILEKVNSFNKSPGSSWYMGLYRGEVRDTVGNAKKGIGLVEFIDD